MFPLEDAVTETMREYRNRFRVEQRRVSDHTPATKHRRQQKQTAARRSQRKAARQTQRQQRRRGR